MEVIQLSEETLVQLAKQIPCPTYNRQEVKVGIVHIGVGGFHRSHQAYYIHQLLSRHDAVDWGICGVGLREADRAMYTVLKKQDCLYTLTVQHPSGAMKSEVIGALQDFLLAVDTPHLVIDQMAHPDTKIVSLTITEGGYNFNPSTGMFNFDNKDVQHELQFPHEPKTVYGFITLALKKRRANGLPPFTVLSCDNMLHNGDIARKMVLAFAHRQDSEFAAWIEEHVSFPNTMVDRITPVTTTADINYLQATHQFKDEWPVICEPYIQWVVEDDFSNGRPAFEKLGVQFVSDVTPYEKMKIRLLNAGHSVLGIPGALYGHPTIHACMEDGVFAKFMRLFMDEEVSPVLDTVDGINLDQYKDSLAERFANPNIKDSVSRICSESAAKLPKFLIPTIQENVETGGSIKYATLVLAAWCFYSDKGVNEKQEGIEILDVMKKELHEAAKQTQDDAVSFLKQREIFGDLVENDQFTKRYIEMVELLYKGVSIRKLMNDMI